MKRLIIGDIHGCYAELQALLDKAGLSTGDEIIALGDIVDRGPDSPRVLAFFMSTVHASSLQGNHERKHARAFRGELRPALSQRITRRQVGEARYPAACAYFDRLPLYLDLPEALLVHGFVEPRVPLPEQRATVLAGTMSGDKHLKNQYDAPWYERYDGDKPVVVGHQNYTGTREPFVYADRVFGLDTGCYSGGALTGLLLPAFRLISVPSRGDYWAATKAQHADLWLADTPDKQLLWDHLELLLALPEKRADLSPALQERLPRLAALQADAEAALQRLLRHIARENERVLRKLRATGPFDELSPREQGQVYAQQIGDAPLAAWLHLARKGELSLERLRRRFEKPTEAIAFVARLLG